MSGDHDHEKKLFETHDSGSEKHTESASVPYQVDFRVGDLFTSRYTILSGGLHGGMGAVYKCRDAKLNNAVTALKIMDPNLLHFGSQAIQRFRQEVAISRQLRHENIVAVYDLGEHEYLEYFTMEWVEGRSLRDIIVERKQENRPFTFDEAYEICCQLLNALQYAHQYTVHRDIKPENILIRSKAGDDRAAPIPMVKLSDFGLAKMLTPSQFQSTSTQVGTAYYMAPEQISDPSRVDKRADIYSVGIILFELLTLEIPVASRELPSDLNKDVPRDIDIVFSKAVTRNPGERYQEAKEFLDDLTEIKTKGKLGARGSGEVPKGQIRGFKERILSGDAKTEKGDYKKRLIIFAAGIVLAFVLFLLYTFITRTDDERVFEGDNKLVTTVIFSRDGRYVLSGHGEDEKVIKLWTVEGKEKAQFKGHLKGISSVAVSPDDKMILSGGSDKTVRLWDIATGKEIKKFEKHTDTVRSVKFSPDGKSALSGGDDHHIKLWDIETGKDLLDIDKHTGKVYSVDISPDGHLIASGSNDNTARVWDAKTGKEIRKFAHRRGKDVRSVAFSPDGKYVLAGGDDKFIRLYNLATGETEKTYTGHEARINSVAFSPDGKLVLSSSNDNTVRLWDTITENKIRSFEPRKRSEDVKFTSAAFSPDGKYIVSATRDGIITLWKLP